LGWNSAEIPGQAFMQGKSYTVENFQAQVKKEYPNNSDEVLAVYQANSVEEVELAATAMAADRFISYSTWKWFDLHRKNSTQNVYRYLYSKIRPPMVDQTLVPGLAGGTQSKSDAPAATAPKAVGAPHACEIEYCMGNLHLVKEYAWTADDKKVSETMSNYFANFIKNYNPNAGNLPEWKSAKGSDGHPPIMIIDTVSKTENANHDARYELHDKLFKNK
jgi:para-nitrobenzyl esterase